MPTSFIKEEQAAAATRQPPLDDILEEREQVSKQPLH